MKSVGIDIQICRNPKQIFNEIDGHIVMLDINNETYYSLDDVGSSIWRELAEPCKIEQLIDKLVNSYEVTHSQCREDIEPFIDELISAGVIKIIND